MASVGRLLRSSGYDGLCTDGCGCGVGDLAPCGTPPADCRPAYRWHCDRCAESGECSVEVSTVHEYAMPSACDVHGSGCYRESPPRA
jgi:hypothetical protein